MPPLAEASNSASASAPSSRNDRDPARALVRSSQRMVASSSMTRADNPMPHFTELIDALPSSMIGHRALEIACDKKQGEGTDDERRAEWLPLYFVPNHRAGELVPFM